MTKNEILTVAKPILFNQEMVRAILDGRKTQTRRTIPCKHDNTEIRLINAKPMECIIGAMPTKCNTIECRPRYNVGDCLYVRETWQQQFGAYWYAATPECGNATPPNKWRPSIHMPKTAARLFLRVTDVRCERLQDISPFDCAAEGIQNEMCAQCIAECGECHPQLDVDVFCGNDEQITEQYAQLWDSTVNKSDIHIYGWDANPWVWVYDFKKILGGYDNDN